jgi:6-phosphogluconate dehydrogenase
MEKAQFGVVGMGVMGQSLALNIANKGYSVAVYNRTDEKTVDFINGPAKEKEIIGTYSYAGLANMLEKPRRLILMVKAGPVVDAVIEQIKPHLDPDDILMDGGNSYFMDTEQREKALNEEGLLFLGVGVSGGEEGALNGPSMMAGGDLDAWKVVEPILTAAAAKAKDGEPCVDYMGPGGAGHYVKTVHNGIEYAIMQLISEAYDVLHRGLNLSADELGALFTEWNEGELSSYLIEITSDIFKVKDPDSGKPLIDLVLDEAKQKGTGKWTSQNAMDLGAPLHTINAAVSSRIISGMKEQRVAASQVIKGPETAVTNDKDQLIRAVKEALYASIILAYIQGFGLMVEASKEYGYELEMKKIARIWRAGCIIQSDLLDEIMKAYDRNSDLENLLMDVYFQGEVIPRQGAMRYVIQTAVGRGIPVYAFSASLAYFDAFRTARLPANLVQAQRDYFGAHTYRRLDKDGSFHTDWEEKA